jgi:LacI family transcriptional regulator, repressor for deo operon, udp, cdd, tsx, nupC, and nupG
LALGAIYGARQVGLDVPTDVSIVGFDNLEYAEMMVPQITTVNQPCREIGVSAMERVQELLNGQDDKPKVTLLEHELVIRGSTSILK